MLATEASLGALEEAKVPATARVVSDWTNRMLHWYFPLARAIETPSSKTRSPFARRRANNGARSKRCRRSTRPSSSSVPRAWSKARRTCTAVSPTTSAREKPLALTACTLAEVMDALNYCAAELVRLSKEGAA